jgi:catechol 2,3-dioxygenase-like lactoylglutathione lyase family enzyme
MKMDKKIAFQHIGIGAKNVKALSEWYCDVLGLEKVYEIPGTDYRSGMPCIAIGNKDKTVIEFIQLGEFDPMTGKQLPEKDRGNIVGTKREMTHQGMNHFAFRVDNFEEFASRLSDKGVKFINHRKTSKGWTMGMISDPEGNLIELFYSEEPLPYEI